MPPAFIIINTLRWIVCILSTYLLFGGVISCSYPSRAVADLGGANAPPFGGTLKNDYAAMACSNNSQAEPGVVRWVRSNPPSYQRTYRMALLYFQALACSGDEQLTVRSTVVPGTKFTASKIIERVELAETERLGNRNETTI